MPTRSKYRYGVILDAGSSGTRVHIYRWLKTAVARAVNLPSELHRLPVIKTKNKKWTMKVQPGISEYGDKAEIVGPEHLKELFEFALDVIPESEVEDTPIFLLATAGMRLLEEMPRQRLLAEVCRYAREKTNFYLPSCDDHIQVIPGETEGLYGWIASNYLVGGFDKPDETAHHTYGFLDMGGASAQIAFAPNSTEAEKHADDLKLLRMRTVDGASFNHKLFVTTFLGYGANEARRRYLDALAESTDATTQALPDPCLPTGLDLTKDGAIIAKGSPEAQGTEAYLRGTGKFSECLASTYRLLDKDAACADAPCLFHGVHVPAIDFSINHFIGVSNFWHGTHEIFNMGHKDRAYDFATYQQRVTDFCSADWSSIESRVKDEAWGDKVDEETAAEVCFKASWIINVLHDGIGVPRQGLDPSPDSPTASNGTEDVLDSAEQQGYLLPFQAVNKIDDTEVSWTLGKMVLYASSQIPPTDPHSLAVGFGTNIPGTETTLPPDFQEGGGRLDVFSPDFDLNDYDMSGDDDDDDDSDNLLPKWRGKLLEAASAGGRTPGYVLFGVILVVVGLLLLGRERRANLFRKIVHPFHSDEKFRGLGQRQRGWLGGGGTKDRGAKYERLMEEGELANPAEFELAHISGSDDDAASSSSRGSNSSGTGARGRAGAVTPRRSVQV